MILYCDRQVETVRFGLGALQAALEKRGVPVLLRETCDFTGAPAQGAIVVPYGRRQLCAPGPSLEPGGFEIRKENNCVFVIGADHAGTMYGLLDMAETVDLFGVSRLESKVENPFLAVRGVKFNLPFEPYDTGDPMVLNEKTCLNEDFWRQYIDFLAKNRYNCLSLWSEHPFHMLFRLEKYPDTCPYADAELARYQALFHFIFRHAKNRGIRVFLITWNIRLTRFAARGLGLPEEAGDMFDRYNILYDKVNGVPNNIAEFDAVRQHLPIVKDYFKECVRTLVLSYRDLAGIGTNCAEEMVGTPEERQEWVVQTYMEAIRESGRDIPFIMRTNSGNGKTAKKFVDAYPCAETYISWKYSNAHMYSHPQPQFERRWKAWEGVNMDEVKVLYTVRNDDFHTLRWGDSGYIRAYLTGLKKPYVAGFYWGADGYLWGDDFQHIPHGHKVWTWDFERHWHEFELLGRLGYNPALPDDVFIEKYKRHYGESRGARLHAAMAEASAIIPAVNRLFWLDYDTMWHPESLLSAQGFKTVVDFVNSAPMPEIGTVSIREYAKQINKQSYAQGETPADIISIIEKAAAQAGEAAQALLNEIPAEALAGELACVLLDLKAWAALGGYYALKFEAALELACFDLDGDVSRREKAAGLLAQALCKWQALGAAWAEHYMPYKMVRTKRVFGWPYYTDLVRRDIELARNYPLYS